MLCLLTLLIFGELHRAVDIGSHFLCGEVAPLLVPSVRIVSLCLHTTLTTHEEEGVKKQHTGSALMEKNLFYQHKLEMSHCSCAHHSHPASQWLHKHLMAALLCTPGPAHHSQPALCGNKSINQSNRGFYL